MKTIDQILKIRAAMLYVFNRFPSGIDYIKLFKVLYFAQQEHLVTFGRSIINENFVAESRGPVASFVRGGLKAIENNTTLTPDYAVLCEGIKVYKGRKYPVFKTSAIADIDELSLSEQKLLEKYIDKFKYMTSKQVSNYSHNDKAWQTAYERAQKDPQQYYISTLEIANAGGASESTKEYIRYNIELDQALS